MTTLRAVLVDDEPRGLNALKLLVERYCPTVKIVSTCLSPVQAVEEINTYRPEIVFLDINMPEMNGFDLLGNLEWSNFQLIFTTAHQEFALKALKSNALDYLLKPIDRTELTQAVERVQKKIGQEVKVLDLEKVNSIIGGLQLEHFGKIKIHSRSGIDAVEPATIISLESKSNYTQLYVEDREPMLSSRTLKDYEFILCGHKDYFMRVHHSFIINLRKVIRYVKTNETVIMENNQEIPISKSRKEEFVSWLEH